MAVLRASEFLKKLADLIDCVETSADESSNKPTDPNEQPPMVPPLQQNIELLKKATGVESIYDDQPSENTDNAELTRVKKNAGLPMVVAASSNFPSN